MAHFLQLLISQARNNIFEVFQSLKLTTHHVVVTGALGPLQYGILHTPGLHKKNHFLQMLISQSRNNILEVFQSLKLTTHHVVVTGALGTLQEVILHTPRLHIKSLFPNAYISV